MTLIVSSERKCVATTIEVERALAISEGMNMAKDLANLPGNICTPAYLADTATKIAAQFSSISTKVLE